MYQLYTNYPQDKSEQYFDGKRLEKKMTRGMVSGKR
jgi:hypothetical protein